MALGFGLQIIQSTIRKLQFTFLDHVESTNSSIRRFVGAYLFPTSVLEHLFLFEKMADTCRAFHKVAFNALEVHLKARGFLRLMMQHFL